MVDREVLRWAETLMLSRPPDFHVWTPEGELQLERWYVVPRNDVANVYLHRFLRSDRTLHNHRGDNRSWLLTGRYRERLETGDSRLLVAGDVVERRAADPHFVELIDDEPAISLFFIGPIVRDWEFICPDGRRVPWRDYVEIVPGGNVQGRGCG